MFIRFDRNYERDRQTYGNRMTAKAALDASIARQKHGTELVVKMTGAIRTRLKCYVLVPVM